MKPAFSLVLIALAAAPLVAQKPEAGDPAVARWREQGVALCVAELGSVDGFSPDALEAICGCTFARLDPPRIDGALPVLGPGRPLRQAMRGAVAFCTFEREPERVQDVARWLAGPDPAPPAAVVPPLPPTVDPAKPVAPQVEQPGSDLETWWNSLAWPDWLSGLALPRWSWGFLVLLALLGPVLLRRLSRRDAGRDLTGPPAHMRPRGPK